MISHGKKISDLLFHKIVIVGSSVNGRQLQLRQKQTNPFNHHRHRKARKIYLEDKGLSEDVKRTLERGDIAHQKNRERIIKTQKWNHMMMSANARSTALPEEQRSELRPRRTLENTKRIKEKL